MPVRFPSKANTLRFLRRAGIAVGTVIDAGVQEETLELRQAFPDLRHILFEPASEFHEALRKNYAGMDYVLVPTALSDRDGTGRLRRIAADGGKTTHAILVDEGSGEPLETVATMRLDRFMKSRDDPKPYLLKLDVDGSEMPVLRGSEGIWDDVSCIIIEATAASFAERMNFLLSKGFKLFDIVDQCYYYGMFSQADLVFVAGNLMENPDLRPWETKTFSWDQWLPVASFEAAVQRSVRLLPLKFWKGFASRQRAYRKNPARSA